MKFFVWLIRVLVFVLLLVLALANTQTATLNFLAGYFWQAPLILIGLAFFVVGLLAGLLSSLPAMFRLRMENGRLKRELRVARETPVVRRRTADAAADLSRYCASASERAAHPDARPLNLLSNNSHGSRLLVAARHSRRVCARLDGVAL